MRQKTIWSQIGSVWSWFVRWIGIVEEKSKPVEALPKFETPQSDNGDLGGGKSDFEYVGSKIKFSRLFLFLVFILLLLFKKDISKVVDKFTKKENKTPTTNTYTYDKSRHQTRIGGEKSTIVMPAIYNPSDWLQQNRAKPLTKQQYLKLLQQNRFNQKKYAPTGLRSKHQAQKPLKRRQTQKKRRYHARQRRHFRRKSRRARRARKRRNHYRKRRRRYNRRSRRYHRPPRHSRYQRPSRTTRHPYIPSPKKSKARNRIANFLLD